jgi:riboflavin biosynthesis pyrimidine reductase
MGRLIYSLTTSLDGFVSDPAGNFGWGGPEQEVHEYARIWQATDKIVYSTTLNEVASARTRIEPTFDPDAVHKLKVESDLDIAVAGPHLAAQAIRAGLVDEYRLFVGPAIVGGGNPFFPDDVRVGLELWDERRFGNGVVYLRYGVEDRRQRE